MYMRNDDDDKGEDACISHLWLIGRPAATLPSASARSAGDARNEPRATAAAVAAAAANIYARNSFE